MPFKADGEVVPVKFGKEKRPMLLLKEMVFHGSVNCGLVRNEEEILLVELNYILESGGLQSYNFEADPEQVIYQAVRFMPEMFCEEVQKLLGF